nr:uncharacterized protein LOC127304325 [Lolium perenne]
MSSNAGHFEPLYSTPAYQKVYRPVTWSMTHIPPAVAATPGAKGRVYNISSCKSTPDACFSIQLAASRLIVTRARAPHEMTKSAWKPLTQPPVLSEELKRASPPAINPTAKRSRVTSSQAAKDSASKANRNVNSSLHRVLPTRRRRTPTSPAEITAALRDLTTAVQEIRLFLAGPYGPPLPAALLPWQPTHQAAFAAIAGPLQPTMLLSSPPPDAGLLQSPLPLSTISGPSPTSAPGVPILQQPAAFFPTRMLQQQQLSPPPTQLLSSPTLSLPFGGQLQQQQQLPSRPTPQQRLLPPPTPSLPFGGVGATLAPGSTLTPPGMPFHQVYFPPSPSPLPPWITIRHVSAAVRLQAAARGLLVRRRVREMRDLQLQLLQVALRCAPDLDLVRCVGDLGRAVSPMGGGHVVFPAGSDLKLAIALLKLMLKQPKAHANILVILKCLVFH